MKKLFILIMLAFLLCPCTTWAQHTAHNDIDFEPWNEANSLPTEGNYYLNKDVTISSDSYYNNVVTGTLSLCLNGHKIIVSDTYYAKFIYEVPEGNTLNLYDCSTTTTQGYVSDRWHPGTPITDTQPVSVVGGYTEFQKTEVKCVLVEGGVFNQYGGNLSGGEGGWISSTTNCAGGVTIINNGTYNLHGGSVVGCIMGMTSGGTSNVSVIKGTFNMHGGAVKASGTTSSGSISIESEGVFNMYGGEISYNIEKSGDGYSKSVYIGGVFNMYGGQISNNTIKNECSACVYGNGGSFNMYGGEIKNNTTLNGAVYAGGVITYTFGGNAVVKDNKISNNQTRNVYLEYSNDIITIATGDAPQSGMNVGVTLGFENGLGKFTNPDDNAANYVNYFFSDEGHNVVCKNDKCLYIHNHSHGNWLFATEGNVITAQCRNEDCDEPPYKCQYITLNASDQIYNGSPCEATYQQMVLSGVTSTTPTITYYKRNESSPLPEAPSGRGLYTAKLTVTLNSVNFTIAKDFKITEPYNLTEGDYYLYNPASGKWFGAGNENGFQASLTEAPEFVHIGSTETAGIFIITSYIDEDGHYFNGSVINATTPCQVQFLKPGQDGGSVAENVCTITSTNDDVYGYDGSSSVLSKNATGANSYWKIYTKAQLIEGLQSADLTHNTIDATFLILDPSFGRSSHWFSQWHGTPSNPSNEGSLNDMYASMEGGKFNVYQDLELNLDDDEEIPNGIYELSVQGFYSSSTSDKRCAYFYANNEAMALKNISSIAHQPTTEEEASEAFTAGKYQCSTLRFLVINNKIRIGVKGVYGECGWTAFDNFRLKYLGSINQLNN